MATRIDLFSPRGLLSRGPQVAQFMASKLWIQQKGLQRLRDKLMSDRVKMYVNVEKMLEC